MDKSRLYEVTCVDQIDTYNMVIVVKSKFNLSKPENWYRVDRYLDNYNIDYGSALYCVMVTLYNPPKI